MIPRDYVVAWRAQAPWRDDAQVEQDLVITRALGCGRRPAYPRSPQSTADSV